MEPMHRTPATSRTPLAPCAGGASAPRRRRPRGWLGWVTGVAMMVAVGLAAPPPAAACSVWDPVCWIETGWDYVWDTVKGVLQLTGDVITLNFDEAFEDLQEVVLNYACGPGPSQLVPLLSVAVSNGLEADFDDSCSPSHPIDQATLDKLKLYIKSPLDTVVIHEECNLDADVVPGNEAPNRNAITFGEHIYFKKRQPNNPPFYDPQTPEGFARLAHELTHVLQYRQKGLADFTCEYATLCMLGLNKSCEIEQSAYDYDDLVLKDQQKDKDGIFSLVDNCPDVFNPGQEDSDDDGVGNVCDGTNQSDILWRHVDGTVAIWHDAKPDWTEWPGALDHYWQIQGVGDFDGDGHSDILWRHVTGQVAYWSAGWPHGVWTGIVDHYWQIQGVGDFDGDGTSDILWRSRYGTVAIWPAGWPEGSFWTGTLDDNWQIQGVGDFNGDGTSDILWRHLDLAQNIMVIWPSGHVDGAFGLPILDHNWQIQGIGKFD